MNDESKMSKYARKLARRQREAEMAQPNIVSLSVAFQRVEMQKREELPEQKAAKAAQPKKQKKPEPEARGTLHDLGDRPQRAAKFLEAAADCLRSAEALLDECYSIGGRGAQRGEVLSILGCVRATYPRIDAVAIRARRIPNAKARISTGPRRAVPEAQNPPRQETGPSPAILEGTR